MSYLFTVYLWKKSEYAPLTLGAVWAGAEPRFAGEKLVNVAVTPKVQAAFYFPGNFSTKSGAFAYGCQALLFDGWGEAPAKERNDAGDGDFRYLVWASSDMFEYDVVIRYDGFGFEGRAIIDGQGERVLVEDDVVKDYEQGLTHVNPADFGVVGDDDSNFDEKAYHEAAHEREKPFSPRVYVHETLGVTRQQVIKALHDAWNGKGKTLWPPGDAHDTPELLKALQSNDAIQPDVPLWSDWGEKFVRQEKPKVPEKKTTTKKTRKKTRDS